VDGLLDILKIIFYYPIFNILMFFYWVVRDFGLSIVLLTICVRLAMVPMTFKQLRYSRKMQELQPRINELKAQHQGDNQALMKAQSELFKEHGVSMFGLGGCLPLLVQMPFLYGLFYALRDGLHGTVGEINSLIYPFLKFTSVTAAGGTHPLDPFLRWFSWLPGNPALNLNFPDPTHILPILAALFTFIQIRMSQVQRKNAAAQAAPADSKAAAQQQATQSAMGIMQYIMPAFTLWIGWQYAAGLALYWTIGTVFTMGQQYIISGWGGLFKGIPRLEAWGKQKDAEREARRAEKRGAPIGPVVDAAPAPNSKAGGSAKALTAGSTRNGSATANAKSDWIDQAKTESQSNGKAKPRTFATLAKSKEPAELTTGTSGEATASGARKNGDGSGGLANGSAQPPAPRSNQPPVRKNPSQRSGTLPKPKGGKR
jgi:YidC/Oxa1 family membrane protein insertase